MNSINKEIAKRSVIYSNNILSLPDIVQKFKKCGVTEVVHWPLNQLSLIQCSSEHNINNVLRQLKTIDSIQFRVMKENKNIRRVSPSLLNEALQFLKTSVKYIEVNKCHSGLFDSLSKAETMSEQIEVFHKFHQMSEYDIKLRQCYSMNIERCIQDIVPTATVALCGSSTTGLGKYNSDLDLKIIVDDVSAANSVSLLKKIGRHLRSINRSMVNYSVYNCRFPICHYHDYLLNINVDLSSLQHDTSLDTACLLRKLCDVSKHLSPLSIVIKQIYNHEGILSDGPNQYFTGFKIVSLLIHFLQSRSLLPPLSAISNVSVVTTSDPPSLSHSLSTLLIDFFRYLIDFQPLDYDIDLGDGQLHSKTAKDFINCVTHLDRSLNIMRNIRQREWDMFTDVNRNILSKLTNESLARFINIDEGVGQSKILHINK